MPAHPRPSKKAVVIVEKILGKPDNKQSKYTVHASRITGDGLNTTIDRAYNKPI